VSSLLNQQQNKQQKNCSVLLLILLTEPYLHILVKNLVFLDLLFNWGSHLDRPCYVILYASQLWCLPPPSPCPGLPTRDDPATVKEPGFASQPIQLKLQAAEPDTAGHLKTAYTRWSLAWHSIAVFLIQFFSSFFLTVCKLRECLEI
jgi:hypothetical protein